MELKPLFEFGHVNSFRPAAIYVCIFLEYGNSGVQTHISVQGDDITFLNSLSPQSCGEERYWSKNNP